MSRWRMVVQPRARHDIADAASWYATQRPGLEAESGDDLDATFIQISDDPLATAAVYGRTRQKLLRRFPYVVTYLIGGDAVYVIAVLHAHRDPKQWQGRLG